MVEPVAMGSRRRQADSLAQRLAYGAPTRLADARESPSGRIGIGVTPGECPTRPPVRRGHLGPPNGKTIRDGIDAPATRPPERILSQRLPTPYSFSKFLQVKSCLERGPMSMPPPLSKGGVNLKMGSTEVPKLFLDLNYSRE